MPEVTLLPCPACGNPDAVVSVTTRAAVYCPMCGMCGPCSPKVDTEYVVRQWNALPRAITRHQKTKSCGQSIPCIVIPKSAYCITLLRVLPGTDREARGRDLNDILMGKDPGFARLERAQHGIDAMHQVVNRDGHTRLIGFHNGVSLSVNSEYVRFRPRG